MMMVISPPSVLFSPRTDLWYVRYTFFASVKASEAHLSAPMVVNSVYLHAKERCRRRAAHTTSSVGFGNGK
jgi:hypothetical protein